MSAAWRFDGYKHAPGCSRVHGWEPGDRDGAVCPVVVLSGFPWSDAAWRYLAYVGAWFAFAATPDAARAAVLDLTWEVTA